jgi:hypothetical protein
MPHPIFSYHPTAQTPYADEIITMTSMPVDSANVEDDHRRACGRWFCPADAGQSS